MRHVLQWRLPRFDNVAAAGDLLEAFELKWSGSRHGVVECRYSVVERVPEEPADDDGFVLGKKLIEGDAAASEVDKLCRSHGT